MIWLKSIIYLSPQNTLTRDWETWFLGCFVEMIPEVVVVTTNAATKDDKSGITLQWPHNGRDGVSNQPHHCLLNRLFRRRSKKASKLRVAGLCVGNSPVAGKFPAPMASNAENVSTWWRHHDDDFIDSCWQLSLESWWQIFFVFDCTDSWRLTWRQPPVPHVRPKLASSGTRGEHLRCTKFVGGTILSNIYFAPRFPKFKREIKKIL